MANGAHLRRLGRGTVQMIKKILQKKHFVGLL